MRLHPLQWSYLGLCTLHVLAIVWQVEILVLFTKPLLVSVLAFWFYTLPPSLRSKQWCWLLTGLLFSIGGDVLLMLVENGPRLEAFFLLGLGSFLLAQLAYARAFWLMLQGKKGWLQSHPVWILPFCGYLLVLLVWLWAGIPGTMRLPVLVYALAIVLMAILAFNLKNQLPAKVFWSLVVGVLLFVLSDSLIAINKFYMPVTHARLWIMSTYLAAQWFIAVSGQKIVFANDSLNSSRGF